jgi:hypothetical protein
MQEGSILDKDIQARQMEMQWRVRGLIDHPSCLGMNQVVRTNRQALEFLCQVHPKGAMQ